MATFRVKPSKPVAVFGAVVGIAILVFGAVNIGFGNGFIYLWLAAGLAIVGFNLWAAFSPRGSLQTISSDSDEPPPTRWGTTTHRD